MNSLRSLVIAGALFLSGGLSARTLEQQDREMMMTNANAQLQNLVNGLGSSPTVYLDRIFCMNGEMAQIKDNNTPGYFNNRAPNATVGQLCRGLMEFSADATARGTTPDRDLLAPYRYEATRIVHDNDANSRAQKAAQRLLNVFVNAGHDSDAARSNVVFRSMDGRNYRIHSGSVMDAAFTNAVLQVSSLGIPPRLYPQATEAQVNEAVEACVRGRAPVAACRDVGQELAARHLAKRAQSAIR